MIEYQPADPNFARRVRESFARQSVMALIGGNLGRIEPGAVEINLPFRSDLTQQHGFVHAGIVTTIVDSACGYAALTLMPAGSEVLTIEYKINFLRPATGESFMARAQVMKPGRTITIARGDAFAVASGQEVLVATMLATIIPR